jgi:hypothetical protein
MIASLSLDVIRERTLLLSLGEVGKRPGFEQLLDLMIDFLPQLSKCETGGPARFGAIVAGTERTLERRDQIGEIDLASWSSQAMPAARATSADDQSGLPKLSEQLVEVWFRDFLSGGDLVALNRPATEFVGQLQHRADAILDSRR